MDRLVDESPEYEQVPLNFHLTSVYDYSLQEAFSRVIHKLIDSLPYLENLLNVFCAVSYSPDAQTVTSVRVRVLTRLSRTPRHPRHFYSTHQASSTSRPTRHRSTKRHTTSAVITSKCSTHSDPCTSRIFVSFTATTPLTLENVTSGAAHHRPHPHHPP